MNREISSFINKYVKEIRNNNAAMFIGAGFSKSAGYVDWKHLLKGIAEDLGLDVDKEYDLISLTQYCYNKNGNRSLINDILIDEFSKDGGIDENHKLIARLPILTYWTTNYDSLIEDALQEAGRIVDVKYNNNHLSLTKPHRDAIVYKMHGDKSNPNEAILIKDDYEQYYRKHAQYITALSGDLVSKTFLFVGFSFSDPNINYILNRIRIEYEPGNSKQHYTIIRKPKRSDYTLQEDYEYAQRKHDLFIEDLKRYNIQTLLVDDYSEITDILKEINRKLSHNTVFISGSAQTYGDFTDDEASNFIQLLSKELITEDFNIISGFGLGVGSHVIIGALQEIYMQKRIACRDQLLLRPFPQGIEDSTTRTNLWGKYREDMISRAGISIFLFGNKQEASEIILADGMKSEFEIAIRNHNLIVPVGCTGFVAQEIWNRVNNSMTNFYTNIDNTLTTAFTRLNTRSDNKQLVSDIISFINLFNTERYKPL